MFVDIGIMASSVVTSTGIMIAASSSEVGTAIGNSNSNAVALPAGVTAGDLLLAFVDLDTNLGSPAVPTGWTQVANVVGGNAIRGFARIATGTDPLNIGLSSFPSEDYCAAVLRITGHHTASGTLATDIPSNLSTGTSTTPNPASIAALGLASRLWLAVVCVDRSAALETITAVPAGYTTVVNLVSSATATSTTMAIAERTLTSTGEDPGTFTLSASHAHGTLTLAVP